MGNTEAASVNVGNEMRKLYGWATREAASVYVVNKVRNVFGGKR